MPRTTAADVKAIITVDESIIPDDEALAPIIAAASALVTANCTGAAGPTPEYDVDTLKMIETWLAAHVYITRDPQVASEGADGLSQSYKLTTALGLQNTHYGQMAMLLDTAGGLARLNAQANKGNLGRRLRVKFVGGDCE